ncbi:NACHT, LRR and PYD domains-containing protein 3-like [Chanos chanos]|uniref:NACHT, LRR and PYD domains-containing protein 3-like n=1 Tax=Chanos chanos TaxID=29144 RepID=A0A6J2UV55_CHACN|nr:NACHT, LRR and PYD domains-containing protein 3-like [Chanos chanos]
MSASQESKQEDAVSVNSLPEEINGCGLSQEKDNDSRRSEKERPESPTPSCVSMKSDDSMRQPFNFSKEPCRSDRNEEKRAGSPTPSGVSMKSSDSMRQPFNFSQEPLRSDKGNEKKRAESPTPSCVSMKSSDSMRQPFNLSQEPLRSDKSVETGDLEQHHRALEVFCKTDQTDICKVCAVEEHKGHSKLYREISNVPDTPSLLQLILGNMKTDIFNSYKRELSENYPECLGTQQEDLSISGVVEKMLESFGEQGALRITLYLLDVALSLRKVQTDNKTNLKNKFLHVSEGIVPQGKSTILTDIYTELYITEGGSGEVNNEHEVRQIEMTSKRQVTTETPIKCNDIFTTLTGQRKQIRTVLTKGIAGIGKTVSVQKFILDWAEGKANQDIINVIVPLPFRDLNLKKENCSLIQLLYQHAPELKGIRDIENEQVKMLLIFDGLDECRFPLDFQNTEICCDVTKSTSVDVLLTNLIKGNLLPFALLWITSRPAAASQIPPEFVHQVTEIRGFRDAQKVEYFKKRISDQSLANRIITHIKSSRSLYIMCHIPVFCWLSATVLENMMSDAGTGEIPKTLTEMYTHFLLTQISLKNKKYHGLTEENPKKLTELDREMIMKLGKLAFQQLEKGSLIFYEDDLRKCGIDVGEASEYSSVCTEIFREELGLYREKVYCFVHLTIQEHLAAVYAHVSCVKESTNVFLTEKSRSEGDTLKLSDLHQSAVTKALQSENGHLDLFLRFLLGLSLDSNQILLQDLMTKNSSELTEHSAVETIKTIQRKITEESSPDSIINLFHCLSELHDNSLLEEVQTECRLGTLSTKKMSPDQCSALAYTLLMSEEVLSLFDLKRYKTTTEGQHRLLPVLRTCRKARLDQCHLSSESCVTVASALWSVNSTLGDLDLSYNNLTDSGVKLLFAGMRSSNCKLEKLKLSWCGLTEHCCEDLASVFRSHHSKLKELDLRDNDLCDSGVKQLSDGLGYPYCKLEKLGLSGCLITEEGCDSLASALRSNPSHLRELDLSYNHPTGSGLNLLLTLRKDPQYTLEELMLSSCLITEEGCASLASALHSNPSHLRELDLSYNHPGDSGGKRLSTLLEDPHCKLEKLSLRECNLTKGCCGDLASALASPNSSLRELELRDNYLRDSGVELLLAGLKNPNCKLQSVGLRECGLTKWCCEDLASVMQSTLSMLRELELRDNDLQDSGVEHLSPGLKDANCKSDKLGLSACLITEQGCAFLASALKSNPSHLNELDLSDNHPGGSGLKLLSALPDNPDYKWKKLQ